MARGISSSTLPGVFILHSTPRVLCSLLPCPGCLSVRPQKLDDLWHAKKDLDDLFLFEPTYTLQLEEESTVEVVTSHKSNKIEVRFPWGYRGALGQPSMWLMLVKRWRGGLPGFDCWIVGRVARASINAK